MNMSCRCHTCNKKLPLSATIGAMCKCGYVYCNGHLMNHVCDYKHFEKNQERLKDTVIKIVPSKLNTT